jgi:hypothetical protein
MQGTSTSEIKTYSTGGCNAKYTDLFKALRKSKSSPADLHNALHNSVYIQAPPGRIYHTSRERSLGSFTSI